MWPIRPALRVGARLAALVLPAFGAGYLAAQDFTPQRLSVEARKFAFAPKEYRAKKGQPVTLVLTSPDFVHGFAIPELNVRVDLIPGKVTELTLTPDRVGKFAVLCDNFCGEDHEKMTGYLIVTE